MLWKTYALIYVIMTAIGFLVLIPSIGSWNFASWEGTVESLLLALGVIAFVYKMELFNKQTWKYIFIAISLFWVAGIIAYATNVQFLNFLKANAFEQGTGVVLFSIIISIPALIAIYRMGFPKDFSHISVSK